MAVTEVGTPTTDWQEGTGSLSMARTVTAGSKGLSVQLSYYNGSGAVAAPTLNWNTSEAFTLVSEAGADFHVAIYFLANPTAGLHSVTATFSNTVYYRAAIREWSNSTSTHGGASATGDSTSPLATVAAVVAGEVILDALISAGGVLPTVGSGQNTTNSYNDVIITAGSIYGAASIDTTSTGSVAMDWTISSSTWSICAMALVEAGASVSRPMFRGH